MTKLIETNDGATLSKGVYDTVIKLRRIADSFERDGMKSSAGAMREAVEVILELETKLRRRRTRRSFRAEETSAELIAALKAADYSGLRASGMSASGQDAERLEAKPASPTPQGDAQDTPGEQA